MVDKSCHFRISKLEYFHLQFMININNIGLDGTNWTEHQKIETFMLSVDHNTQRK